MSRSECPPARKFFLAFVPRLGLQGEIAGYVPQKANGWVALLLWYSFEPGLGSRAIRVHRKVSWGGQSMNSVNVNLAPCLFPASAFLLKPCSRFALSVRLNLLWQHLGILCSVVKEVAM